MLKRFLFLAFLLFTTPVLSLELTHVPLLEEGESRIMLGGSVLWGAVSPPDSYTRAAGVSDAKLYKETLNYARGLGEGSLKNIFLEVETAVFQSSQETVGGTLVYPANKGWLMQARSGGNFIVTPSLTMGGWLQTGTPIIMDKSKFVNPIVDYVGVGIYTTLSVIDLISINNTAYVGSGLFLPKRRNPSVQDTALLILNLGANKSFLLKGGISVDYDLTSRVDANYLASPLGDGTIKNFVIATPFLADVPLGGNWSVNGGYVMLWKGRSIRGTETAVFNLAKKF
ncbi:MAG: hypothetical protein Q7T03_03015 [Deltaproteobacteria bacterium]|nr:hypothetical protein [Deltaproteobacteria bacterium]